MKQPLYKSKEDKAIFGVCGGLAKHWQKDSLVLRLLFVFLAFACGLGIILYVILAIFMKKESEIQVLDEPENTKNNVIELEAPKKEIENIEEAPNQDTLQKDEQNAISLEAPKESKEDFTDNLKQAEELFKNSFQEKKQEENNKTTSQEYKVPKFIKQETKGEFKQEKEEVPKKKKYSTRKIIGLILVLIGAIIILKVIFPFASNLLVFGVINLILGLYLLCSKEK